MDSVAVSLFLLWPLPVVSELQEYSQLLPPAEVCETSYKIASKYLHNLAETARMAPGWWADQARPHIEDAKQRSDYWYAAWAIQSGLPWCYGWDNPENQMQARRWWAQAIRGIVGPGDYFAGRLLSPVP